MSTATPDTPDTTRRDKAADAIRHATHASHEVQLLKSLAGDAVEDGMYAVRRAYKTVRRRLHEAGDLRDEAIYRVKRDPLRAIGAAFGAGLLLGAATGLLIARRPRRQTSQ